MRRRNRFQTLDVPAPAVVTWGYAAGASLRQRGSGWWGAQARQALRRWRFLESAGKGQPTAMTDRNAVASSRHHMLLSASRNTPALPRSAWPSPAIPAD
jgi:hypothetical protein